MSCYIMLYNMMPNNIRTHTYWMSVKQYKKKTFKTVGDIKLKGDETIARTHIYFN